MLVEKKLGKILGMLTICISHFLQPPKRSKVDSNVEIPVAIFLINQNCDMYIVLQRSLITQITDCVIFYFSRYLQQQKYRKMPY